MIEQQHLVIGLGEIGRPLFNLIQRSGARVTGVDVEPARVDEAVGVAHLCFPFDVPRGFVEVAAEYALKYKPQVLVVNSTVRPGTTRALEQRTGVPAVYSPVRGKHTKMEADLHHYQKFVAGTQPAAVELATAHLRAAGFRVATMAQPESLELAKLLETTYFGLLIAWAQEMERMGKEHEADYFEMQKFFSEIGYLPSHVFVPGHIGGHCVLPNIGILKSMFESSMLDAILDSNTKKGREIGAVNTNGPRVQPIEHERKR